MGDEVTNIREVDRAITSQDRWALVEHADSERFVKSASIIALQMHSPFRVETEHGVMGGEAGDFLATNHPDDDASSDVWPISGDRFRASYRPFDRRDQQPGRSVFAYEGERTDEILERIVRSMRDAGPGRAGSLAITKLEEAIHWLRHRG